MAPDDRVLLNDGYQARPGSDVSLNGYQAQPAAKPSSTPSQANLPKASSVVHKPAGA